MSNQNQADQIPWGCVGTTLAAIIMALVTLIVAMQPQPMQPPFPEVTLQNNLRRPVSIYVGNTFDRRLQSGATAIIKLERVPTDIRFEVVYKETKDGKKIGDRMVGVFHRVFGNEDLKIDHVIGDQSYFYPILNNNTNLRCSIIINDGLLSAQRVGVLGERARNVHIGYYKWFSNSNVTLKCDDGTTKWWGQRNGKGESITRLIDPHNATVTLTLK